MHKQLNALVLLIVARKQYAVSIEHPLRLLLVTLNKAALICRYVELIVLPVNEPHTHCNKKNDYAGGDEPGA